jgi:hypothetical protein
VVPPDEMMSLPTDNPNHQPANSTIFIKRNRHKALSNEATYDDFMEHASTIVAKSWVLRACSPRYRLHQVSGVFSVEKSKIGQWMAGHRAF